jgi:ribonuclease J
MTEETKQSSSTRVYRAKSTTAKVGSQKTTKDGDRPTRRRPNQRKRAAGPAKDLFGAPKKRRRRRPMSPKQRHPLPRRKRDDTIPPLADGDIRVIPLGGVQEIGRNMTMLEYKDEIIVIDAGIGFSDEDTPGIDYVIPNISYLEDNVEKIKALVITHGHLDHIGAIPYVLDKIGNPPVYSREFGALLIKKKLDEFPHIAKQADIRLVTKDEGPIQVTDHLKVRFFGLTHSIPDSTGVIIETPYGDIVSTGDVRVENDNGVPVEKEVEQYKFFQDRNVLLFTMDSTGITAPGWSQSEAVVIKTVDEIIRTTPSRLIIATFASQVERIMEFIKSAKKYGKYVVVDGRSMKTNLSIVQFLDLTDMSHVISVEEAGDYPPQKLVFLVTGAQGEEFAALMRMANHTHRHIQLQRGDTVVLSSSVIPGNEGAVDNLKDNLYRSDAKVITYIDNQVHASGHGKRDELAWVHTQIPYRYFMPVHGHHYRLKMHRELAMSLGAKEEDIVVPDNGSIIEIRDAGNTITMLDKKAPGEIMTVEGSHIGAVQDVVLRDRKMLSEDGIFMVVISLDPKTGKMRKSPDLISRGFIYLRDNQDLLHKARNLIKRTVEKDTVGKKSINFDYVKNKVTETLSRFLLQQTGKQPIIIPVVLAL